MKLRTRHRAAATIGLCTAIGLSIPLHAALSQTAVTLPAAPGAAGEKFSLKRTFKTGDVDRYEESDLCVMEVRSFPITFTESTRYKETTRTASANGARTFIRDFEAATAADSVTDGGKESDILAGFPKLTITEDANDAVEVKAFGGDPGSGQIYAAFAKAESAARRTLVPPHPVVVGESWDASIVVNLPPLQAVPVKTHIKLASIDKAGALREAREVRTGEAKVDFGGVPGTLYVEQTVFTDVASGKLLRSKTRYEVNMDTGQQSAGIHYTQTLRRLLPGEKAEAPSE